MREYPLAAEALATVLRQVEAFNRHDVGAFADTYADDAVVTGVTPEPIFGRAELCRFYQERFADPALRCTVNSTVVFGDLWVVAHELVENSRGATETVATFEVKAGRITRATMLKASG